MTTPTLQEILTSAYGSSRSKVASAASTPAPTSLAPDFISQSLGLESQPGTPTTSKVAHTEETAVADLDFAEKIALALERSAMIVTKLASEHGGDHPKVVEPNNMQVATQPKAHTSAHGAITGTGKDEKSQGLPGGVQTDSTSSTHKQAAAAMIRSKLAQAEQLLEAGERDLAQQIMNEADEMAKIAGFAIAPAKMPGQSTDYMLGTSETGSGHSAKMPTNEQAIAMTKAMARDKVTAEAKAHISETPKKDNAVPAAVSHTEGLKTSALLREKLASGHVKVARGVGLDAREDQYSVAPLLPFGSTYVGVSRANAKGAPAPEAQAEVPAEKQASAAELIETRNFLEKIAAFASSDEASDADREAAATLIDHANTHGLAAAHAVLMENS